MSIVIYRLLFIYWESFSFVIGGKPICLFDYARKDYRNLLHTYPLEGIRATVARGLREARVFFSWFEEDRSMLAKDKTLCLRILKRMLRKSEQS